MGKIIKNYLFGKDLEDKNLYGYTLQIVGKSIVITQADASQNDIYVSFNVEDWKELKKFIDNEIKNI